MKYPMINRQPRREVNVPQLSGGLNLRDSLSGIRDNQMTDCVNMWYKEGMLRTRPGFVTNKDMMINTNPIGDASYILKINTHKDIKKGDAVLVSAIRCDGDYGKEGYYWQMGVQFWWQSPEMVESIDAFITLEMPDFVWISEESLFEAANKWTYFISAKDGVAYCYASDGENYHINKLDYTNGSTEWTEITNDKIYIPTIMTNGKMGPGYNSYSGLMFEGFNLIGNSAKYVYSTVNPGVTDDGNHFMFYVLPTISAKSITKISAKVIDSSGKTTIHTVVPSQTNVLIWEKAYNESDNMKMAVRVSSSLVNANAFNISIGFQSGNSDENRDTYKDWKKILKNETYIENNMEIIVTYEPVELSKKIFNMSQSIWFGGAANGINGGSRLFLCGNTDENEKSLVVWSSLNNPLYFPENNYAYVGDKSQGVTAFGQQGENLIIFKEKSTYYSYYNVNDNITADDLINQSIVDYEANSAIFPMIQLNANIGCDCPNTVQLCRNRLVWANSDGNVYTLYSNNQYSERTIYKISDMINSMLKKENDLKNAISCDFEGHYLLCIGSRIYVMDYDSYGYQYAASFSKNEDSNVQIPWYIWEIGDIGYLGKLFEMNNRLMLMYDYDTSDGVMLTFSTLSADENTANDNILFLNQNDKVEIIEKKIKSKLQTKLFDFSAAGYLKNIDRVSIAFGNNGGEPINVGFLTDKGSESDVVILAGSSIDERDEAFVTVKNFYVSARAVRTFGVKIECEGPLIIDGLSLQYRMLGGVK